MRQSKFSNRIIIPILILFFLSFLFENCRAEEPYYSRTELAMGTVVKIRVEDQDKERKYIKKAVDEAFQEIRRIDNLLSRYIKSSQISRINKQAGIQAVQVSEETLALIKSAIYFHEISKGAFDVTILPLLQLWGFGKDNRFRKPLDEEIKERLKLVDSKKIIIDEQKKLVKLALKNMKIDLGGIAKGFAVDRAVQKLKERRINSALIEAGGDIYCLGAKSKQKAWRIGIAHPRKKGEVFASIELKDRACATSGDYENFFIKEGRRFSHIINPRTGYPLGDKVVSVTVLAGDCVTADALATAIFVLGPEEGVELAESQKDVEAIIVSRDKEKFRLDLTEGVRRRIAFYNF